MSYLCFTVKCGGQYENNRKNQFYDFHVIIHNANYVECRTARNLFSGTFIWVNPHLFNTGSLPFI